MLTNGFKISWRLFKSGFVFNVTTLAVLVVANTATLTLLMLNENEKLKIMLCIIALLGYSIAIGTTTYSTKFRTKEIIIRKMLGARFKQLLALATIDSTIYMIASSLFSIIIVEHFYEHSNLLIRLSPILMLQFILLIVILSVIISIIPALAMNRFKP